MSHCLKMREKQLHNDHLSFFLSFWRWRPRWNQRNEELEAEECREGIIASGLEGPSTATGLEVHLVAEV